MLALAYAQMVNCESPLEDDSCGTCFSCVKAARFVHPDIHYSFPFNKWKGRDDSRKISEVEANNTLLPRFRQFLGETPFGTLRDWAELAGFEQRAPILNVDVIRWLILGLQLKAYEGKFKIQIVWLPETMNAEGSNAFLKILEEPPPCTLFLLVTEQAESLLPTIISRTQRVSIPALDPPDLAHFLVHSLGSDAAKAELAAELAEGSIPAALALMQEEGTDFHRFFLDWQRACYQNDLEAFLRMSDTFSDMGREMQKSFFAYSLDKTRQALALGQNAGAAVRIPEGPRAELARLGKVLQPALVVQLSREMEKAWHCTARNASSRMVFFDTSVALGRAYQLSRTQSHG